MSDLNFKTIYEFKQSLEQGTEIGFLYNGKEYFAWYQDENELYLGEIDTGDDAKFSNIDEMLEQELDGRKLRSIITELEVIERNL